MPPAAPVLGAHVRKSLEIAAVRPAFALGLRAATATIAPLVVGDASGQPIFGWMALGGWLCAIADPGGPHLLRARTMAAFAAAAALVTGLGTIASTRPAPSIALRFAGARGRGGGGHGGDDRADPALHRARLTGAARPGAAARRHGPRRLRALHGARAAPVAGARVPARPARDRELLPRVGGARREDRRAVRGPRAGLVGAGRAAAAARPRRAGARARGAGRGPARAQRGERPRAAAGGALRDRRCASPRP